jgi:hypothetical protein
MPRTATRAGPPPIEEPARNDRSPGKDHEPRSALTVARAADQADLDQPERQAGELARQLARRREVALRLPQMECGCHDPEDPRHSAGQCRYQQRMAP